MKNKIIIALVVIVLGYFVAGMLVSDETKIRRRIEGAVAAFNAMKASSTVDIMEAGFRDETSSANKDFIRRYLIGIFIKQQSKVAGEFRYPVTIDARQLEITIDAENDARATVHIVAEFHDLKNEARGIVWSIDVDAQFIRQSGDWLIKKSSYRNLSGKMPW